MDKEFTCCFSGHRKLTLQQTCSAYDETIKTIKRLIERGYKRFCCGGALGYDTLAAQAVIELRERFDIKLVLILPCVNQDQRWNTKDKSIYNQIKGEADEVIYTAQEYASGCMHKRNRALVDSSSVCVCFLKTQSGGTAYTVEYAKKRGLEVINLANVGQQ